MIKCIRGCRYGNSELASIHQALSAAGRSLRDSAGSRQGKPRIAWSTLVGVLVLLVMGLCSTAASAATPTVILTSVTTPTPQTAELSGSVDTHGEEAVVYAEALKGASLYYEQIATIPAGTIGAQSVSGEVRGLKPGTTYSFRLDADVSGVETYSAEPYPTATTPTPPPTFSAAEVTPESALFVAEINPAGNQATYVFEYTPQNQFETTGFAGASQTPAGTIPPVEETETVSVFAGVLTPDTRYVYRLRLSRAGAPDYVSEPRTFRTPATIPPRAEPAPCSNAFFRVGPAANLPDCRAYEQVSPPDKNGGEAAGISGVTDGSSDGNRFAYYSQAGLPAVGKGGTQDFVTLLASRGESSWSTQRLLPPPSFGQQATVAGYVGDLKYAIDTAFTEGVGRGLFELDEQTGELVTIVPEATNPGPVPQNFALAGGSEDGRYVYFETALQLNSQANASTSNLYVWDRDSGHITLAGVLPGEAVPTTGAFAGAYEWATGNLSTGGTSDEMYVSAIHAITANGDQVFFTERETGALFLRRGITGSSPSTVQVSRREAGVGDPVGPQPAAFLEATPGGQKAFFMSSEHLTANANTGPSDEGKDLYRFDVVSDTLQDVFPDPSDPKGAEVLGLLGTSTDGSSGYAVARAALVPGATAGVPNIYRFVEDGNGFRITFVATLEERLLNNLESNDASNWSPAANQFVTPKVSRVSLDGRVLLFSSARELTGYDSEGHQELFRYDAETGSSSCISCTPGIQPVVPPIAGSENQGASLQSTAIIAYGRSGNVSFTPFLSRNMDSGGNRIFFQTNDSLLPEDTNGSSGCPFNETTSTFACQDVYEWQSAGTGSCSSAEKAGGCLSLISTGQSDRPSYFGDASQSGANAFIYTSSQLVPADADALTDVYAVPVGGGIGAQYDRPAEPCTGDDCLSLPTAAPAAPAIGSAAVVGPGNAHRHHKRQRRLCRRHSCHAHRRSQRSRDRRRVSKPTNQIKSGKNGRTK